MTTTTFEMLWAEYQPVVDGIAYRFGGRYKRWGADVDDFRQEAIAWMLDNEKKLARKITEFAEDPKAFERYLAKCIENELLDYGLDVRDQAGGQPRKGAYFYSTNELKALLPAVFDPEKWLEPPQPEGGPQRGKGIPSEGNNWVTSLADVSRAFETLRELDRELLLDYHARDLTNSDVAAREGIPETTASSRHTRALERLQAALGGPKPNQMKPDNPEDPWRGRRALSNAQARAITNSYYEE